MQRELVTFDWAIKHILRDKANFDILEGFLSELLKNDIKIIELLESESNQENERDKFNRVDVLTKDENGTLILIEVQYDRELDYFHRILFGSSKLVTQYFKKSEKYSDIKKVVTVHIVYFDLGNGKDYFYKGTTQFVGIYQNDLLELSKSQSDLFKIGKVEDIFPQNYIIRVGSFNNEVKNTFDEWVYFLKNGDIKENFKAKNIIEAKNKLNVLKLDENERTEYDNYLESLSYQKSVIETAKIEGKIEGKYETAKKMKSDGLSTKLISKYTGISIEEIERL